MRTHEKIRELRENLDWTQEKMAEQLNMSTNGYAKIERGETKLKLDKLEKIAQIFNIDVIELLSSDKGVFFMMNENSDNNKANYYQNSPMALVAEIEKLNVIIGQKDLLLSEKERQIQILNDFIKTLKDK